MLKNFIPDIVQESSLSKISTGVEMLWKSDPYKKRGLFGFGLSGSMPHSVPRISDI
jgi:hypothetical protein